MNLGRRESFFFFHFYEKFFVWFIAPENNPLAQDPLEG